MLKTKQKKKPRGKWKSTYMIAPLFLKGDLAGSPTRDKKRRHTIA